MLRHQILPRATLCVLAVILLSLLWFPVRRTTASLEINYNEGWNAYSQAMAANGTPLYGFPPGLFTGATSYPPLSFHLVGWLGKTSSFTIAGRWISLVSLVVTGIFVGLIVRREGANWEVALFSFLLYLAGIAVLMPSRLGMNDPQLLGEALSTAGLYSYVKSEGNKRWLLLSALTFCLAGFTKQNLIAFPAAVALDLLVRHRKSFAVWAGAMVGFAGLLTLASILVDGHHLLTHLTFPRAYSLSHAWNHNIYVYLLTAQSIILPAILWLICAGRPRLPLTATFLLSHLVAFLLAGGHGVDVNISFNALAAAIIVCGTALADIETASAQPGSIFRQRRLGGALMAVIVLGLMINVPRQVREDQQSMRVLRSQENEFKSAVQFLSSRPGPALCENLLLCYEARKPFEFDPFWVSDGLTTGRVDDDKVLELLKSRHFQSVQIKISPKEAGQTTQRLLEERSRSSNLSLPFVQQIFVGKFVDELLQDYGVVYRGSQVLIFAPR